MNDTTNTATTMTTPCRVLIIDDDMANILLAQYAFEDAQIPVEIIPMTSGSEAMVRLLHNNSMHEPLPDLILLDLNMPRISGQEVLGFIKRHAQLRTIPTVILTTSSSSFDRTLCARLGADDYLVKPSDFPSFIAMMQPLRRYLDRKSD